MAKHGDHNARREIFAKAASRVIMRVGVEGLTVREVAKEASFTTGALTHYFTSKDQVLIEAAEYSVKLIQPDMDRAADVSSPILALRRVVRLSLPINAVQRGYWRIWVGFWERAGYNVEVARIMRAGYDEWHGRLEALIRRAQADGVARADFNPALAAQELIALIDGVGVQVLLGSGRVSARRQREIIDNWIEGMVEGRAGRSTPRARA